MPFDSNDDRQCDSPVDWRSPDRMSIANCAIGPLYDEQIKKKKHLCMLTINSSG